MKCPKCNETLVMADRNGVEIDYCPNCRGVWLDRGELDKILERSAEYYSDQNNYREDYYKDEYRKDDYRKDEYRKDDYKYGKQPYPHKKRKSFFGDFFDFD